MNMILNTDSYKYSHFKQYPPGTQYVSAYIEPRGGLYERVLFAGPQSFAKEYLSKPITFPDVEEAKELIEAHGEPFNYDGWREIVFKHNGFLPIQIQALKEGTVTDLRIPQVQVMNTDPTMPWLTTFIETALLRAVWYSSTVATVSFNVKQTIKDYLTRTADSLDGLPFKLHDFGARGVSSNESAGLGGVSHLFNFMGTDTVAALVAARKYYGEAVAGFSIPAAEHSTITSWGKNGEAAAYANMIEKFGNKPGLVAVVSDSYDIFNAVSNIWGGQLKQQVMESGEKGSCLVIRPDSGDPTRVPVEIMNLLAEKFSVKTNSKGYKMLPDYLRVIQGDEVNPVSIKKCLQNMKEAGWSADNLAFGMGGQLLQQINRDTLQYAMKCNAIKMSGAHGNSNWIPVSKNPVGDQKKASKAGRLAVLEHSNGHVWYETVAEDMPMMKGDNQLEVIWENGKLLRDQSLKEIRERAASYLED